MKLDGKLIGNMSASWILATEHERTRTSCFLQIDVECNGQSGSFLQIGLASWNKAKKLCKFLPQHASVNLLEERTNPEARMIFYIKNHDG